MNKAFIGSLNEDQLSGKYVLLRVDFNVPLRHMHKGTVVANDARIKSALPTIRYLRMNKAKIVICSHLGRPKGKPDERFSLASVAARLSALLEGDNVEFVPDCVGTETRIKIKELQNGEVMLLENLRFHPGEESDDHAFAAQLAQGMDLYVNDAFGAAHRAHASITGIKRYIKHRYAGFLMRDELLYLGSALDHPTHPVVAVVGGAKISTKIEVLSNLMPKIDKLLIGGAMVYTFLAAKGLSVGDSLVEKDCLHVADDILQMAERLQVAVVLAEDSVISPVSLSVHPRHALKSSVPVSALDAKGNKSNLGNVPENVTIPLAADSTTNNVNLVPFAETSDQMTDLVRDVSRVVSNESIPDGWIGVDIGPDTIKTFQAELEGCRTVLWNGPMGIFENPLYAAGTLALMQQVAALTRQGATTVVCGGETVSAVEQEQALHPPAHDEEGRVVKAFTHVSTGGGAALEYLAGVLLPGVNALSDKEE